MNALKPSQIYLQCAYYHRSKAHITAMTVAPLIADSQVPGMMDEWKERPMYGWIDVIDERWMDRRINMADKSDTADTVGRPIRWWMEGWEDQHGR